MNFDQLSSLGLNVLKNQSMAGQALSLLANNHSAAGAGFTRIAQQFGLNSQTIHKAENWIQNAIAKAPTSGNQVLQALQFYDADHNGQITQQELQDGLKKLEDSGQAKSGSTAQWHTLGSKLLSNYAKVAQMDGNSTAISYRDLGQLMAKDQQGNTLSSKDWQSVTQA